jgi:ribonuclease BN (tRNA processing enzyme)
MATRAPKLTLLGTAGGPLPSPRRSGIAQAVVIGPRTYVVDCGSGVTRQLRRAHLLSGLHKVFLTHLHSDHTCDYFNLFLLGWPILQWNPPVHVFGPGSAGGVDALPPDDAVTLHHPANPTPGTVDLTEAEFAAHAYDINVRMREAGRRDLGALVVPHEIDVPARLGASGPACVAPDMEPQLVDEDDEVRVTAVLVRHAPVFPAFAFRFDTDGGSVVLSGDTAPCPNLIRLAAGADILVHEVFDDTGPDDTGPDDTGPDDTGPDDTGPDVGLTADEAAEAARRHHHMVSAHTPLSAVGQVAAEAGVGRLVLTHFIPGDDDLPDGHWLAGVAGAFDGEVIVGHDLMELTL